MRASALWKTPRSPRALIVSVEALCVTWLIAANVTGTPDNADFGRFILLFGIAAVYSEGADRIERLRRYTGYVDNSVISEGSSLWCIAAALVLRPGLAGLLVVAIYAHTLLRSLRHQSAVPHRIVYTGTTHVIAAMSASTLVGLLRVTPTHLGATAWSLVAVLLAVIAFQAINESLIVSVVYLMVRPSRLRAVLASANDRAMENASLAVGVLLGIATIHAPWLSPASVLVMVVLRRSALVHELQVQATRDAKTGLLNAGAWQREAERELARGERLNASISVLMIDLDHFKDLNDAHGHQAGDVALKAVADCITDTLRGYDAVGRFGGEEFVALLAGADATRAGGVAERLCAEIRALRMHYDGTVTASIGVGVGRSGVHSLDDLISVADQALYVAKNSGRDRVHSLHAVIDPTLDDVDAIEILRRDQGR